MGDGSGSSDVSETSELEKPQYDLTDALVYKLANRLGGRSEVIELPVIDALAYLIIILDEEKAEAESKRFELFMNHLSRLNAQPPQDEKDLRSKNDFIRSINPIEEKETKVIEPEWNFEQLERLKLMQSN